MITHFDLLLADDNQLEKMDKSIFELETYFILDFFNRNIKKYKLKFNKVTSLVIIVGGDKTYLEYNEKWPETRKILSCHLSIISYSEIKKLKGKDRTRKVLSIFKLSSKYFEDKVPGVYDSIDEISKSFTQVNYQNIWIHNKKVVKGLGCAILKCELSITEFNLFIEIVERNDTIYSKKLLTSRPSPFMYKDLFKGIIVEDNNIKLSGRIVDSPFFVLSFSDVANCSDGKFTESHPSHPDFIYNAEEKILMYIFEDSYSKKKGTRWWNDFKKQIERL